MKHLTLILVYCLASAPALNAQQPSKIALPTYEVADQFKVAGKNLTFHDWNGDGWVDLFVGGGGFSFKLKPGEQQLYYYESSVENGIITYSRGDDSTFPWQDTLCVPMG